jgi:hypothetical protein
MGVIVRTLCQPQKLPCAITGGPIGASHVIIGPQPEQREEDLGRIAQVLTDFQRASELLLDFARGPAFKQDEGLSKSQFERQFTLNALGLIWQFRENI